MDNREIYVKRMEAAVLQAGSAISKLKADNAELKKENEKMKKEIMAMSDKKSGNNMVAVKDSNATCTAIKPIKAVLPIVRSLDDGSDSLKGNEIAVPNQTSIPIAPKENAPKEIAAIGAILKSESSSLKITAAKKIQQVRKKNYDRNESRAMLNLSIGESLVGVPDLPDNEPNRNEQEMQFDALIEEEIPKNQIQLISTASLVLLPVEKDLVAQKGEMKQNSKEALPVAEKVLLLKRTQNNKPLIEKGWDATFTAGSYSDEQYVDQIFEIKQSLKGLYCKASNNELPTSISIKLLLANSCESNIHSVAKSLKKFQSDLISKHLMDHIRHVSYNSICQKKGIKSVDCDELHIEKKKTKCETGSKNNEFAFLPLLFVDQIDVLVSVIVSMMTRNKGSGNQGMRDMSSYQCPFLYIDIYCFLLLF